MIRRGFYCLVLLLGLGCGDGNLIPDGRLRFFTMEWLAYHSDDSYATMSVTKLPTGEEANAIRLRTGGYINLFSMPVQVDTSKNYRFTVWVKQDKKLTGNRAMGLEVEDAGKTRGGLLVNGEKLQYSPDLWVSGPAKDEEWHRVTGYIVSKDLGRNWKIPPDTTGLCLQSTSATLQLRLRLRSAAYPQAPANKQEKDPRKLKRLPSALFALPRMEEVGDEIFTGKSGAERPGRTEPANRARP